MGKTFKDNKNSDFEMNKKLKREIKKNRKKSCIIKKYLVSLHD